MSDVLNTDLADEPSFLPLKPLDQGSKVADLQTALQLSIDRGAIPADDATRQALSARLAADRQTQQYGDGTRAVVAAFQTARGLATPAAGATGIVDQRTADALNALLATWGVLDGPGSTSTPGDPPEPPAPVPPSPDGTTFTVDGRVLDAASRPLSGTSVAAVDRDLRAEQSLGQTVTDKDGRYEIRYTAQQFARAERGTRI